MRIVSTIRLALLFVLLLSLPINATAEWKEQVLYSFQGGSSDGATPVGRVVFDKAGNLYGATTDGGGKCAPAQCGVVFQLTPPAKKGASWTETVLYIFKGIYQGTTDGSLPAGGLLIDSAGNLYGTTAYGGTGSCVLLGTKVGCGTVYELSPPAQQGDSWTETVLYSFQSGKDGYLPLGDLTFDAAGNLYGATEYGGGYGSCNAPYYQYCGTVFELNPPKQKGGAWAEKVLSSFKGVDAGKSIGDGANPNGGLVFDSKGAIYGTTYFGGDNQQGTCEGGAGGTGCGIVFKLEQPAKQGGSWIRKILYRFQAGANDGANPAAGVTLGKNGNLYGTTSDGPQNEYGTIFEVTQVSAISQGLAERLLYRFQDSHDGAYPMAGVVADASGNLYGTDVGSSIAPDGVVFRLKPLSGRSEAWKESEIYTFTGAPDGRHPTAPLVFAGKDSIFSTTEWGGAGRACQGGCGTIFQLVR